MLEDEVHVSWRAPLAGFFRSPEGQALNVFLQRDEDNYYPARADVFAAFRATHLNDVRVVIIGQEPYARQADATGIAFFANGNSTPSLRNIYTAMELDGIGDANLTNACLERWARQEGVLLLNRVLTFCNVPNDDNMHASEYWEKFMSVVLAALVNNDRMLQFIFWGNEAQELKKYINGRFYHIHAAPHPRSRNEHLGAFLNCRHFSAVNNILTARDEEPINWIRDPNQ